MARKPYKLGVVALHPIQYQAGLWRTLSKHPKIDLHVIYMDTVGIDGSIDPTMNAQMKWDVPLLDGHDSEFVPNLSPWRYTAIVHRINPKLPAAIRSGNFDALIVHGYLTISNWFLLWAAKRLGLPLIYRGEGSVRGGDRNDNFFVNRMKYPLNKYFLNQCALIAHSSMDNREYQISRGAPVDRLFPMPCAVDNDVLAEMAKPADPAAFRKRHDIPADARLVINVGRFSENKRTRDCIEAFAKGPLAGESDVHLLLAGDGPLRAELEAFSTELGLADRGHFLGFLSQTEMVEAVVSSELFAICSSHGDPSPKALAEALALGKPAVCSEGIGRCRDVIEDVLNGYVVPSFSPDALAEAIAKVLFADAAARKAMADHSRSVARRDDFQAGVDSLAHQLEVLLGDSSAPSDAP